jgi:hypothetical protein
MPHGTRLELGPFLPPLSAPLLIRFSTPTSVTLAVLGLYFCNTYRIAIFSTARRNAGRRLFGKAVSRWLSSPRPCGRGNNALKVHFSTTLGEESEIEAYHEATYPTSPDPNLRTRSPCPSHWRTELTLIGSRLPLFTELPRRGFLKTQRDKGHKTATPRSCSYPVVVSFFSWCFFS